MANENDIEYAVRTIDDSTAAINAILRSNDALIDKLTELNQSADVTNQYLGAMTEKTRQSTEENNKSAFSFSELNQGIEVFSKALGYAQQAYDLTIAKSQEYAEQVRDLNAVSGESAENTSRFIQVLDDYQVSAEDAMAATKALTKHGMAPTTETLAKLSEQYLALNTVEDQNAFVTKNLGKAGLEWIQVLRQGPDAIRASSAAVSESMILNKKNLEQAEQLRLAQDQLNDTLDGLSMTVGKQATPAVTTWATVLDKLINNTDGARDSVIGLGYPLHGIVDLTKIYGDTYNELEAKASGAASAITQHSESLQDETAIYLQGSHSVDDLKERLSSLQSEYESGYVTESAYKEQKKELTKAIEIEDAAAKALTATYTTELQLAQNLQGQVDSYNDSMADLNAKQQEAKDALQQALDQGWWPTSQHVQDLQKKVDDFGNQMVDTEKKYSEAMAKMAYDNLVAKLSVDGLTDSEFEMAQKAGVSLGIFSQASADRAIALNDLTTALANGKISVQQFNDAVKNGSFDASTQNNNITNSWSGLSQLIADNTSKSKDKIDDYKTDVKTAADETQTATDRSKEYWDTLASGVTSSVDTNVKKVDEYIDALNRIPPTVNTQITNSLPQNAPQGGTGTESYSNGVGGSVINYYIGTAYIAANHQIATVTD